MNYENVKQTFPWRYEIQNQNGIGGIIKVFDNKGDEVPLLTIIELVIAVSRKVKKAEKTNA